MNVCCIQHPLHLLVFVAGGLLTRGPRKLHSLYGGLQSILTRRKTAGHALAGFSSQCPRRRALLTQPRQFFLCVFARLHASRLAMLSGHTARERP